MKIMVHVPTMLLCIKDKTKLFRLFTGSDISEKLGCHLNRSLEDAGWMRCDLNRILEVDRTGSKIVTSLSLSETRLLITNF